MYCSIHEAWPDFNKSDSTIKRQINEYNHNDDYNESRPELVNKVYYTNNNSEHFKEKSIQNINRDIPNNNYNQIDNIKNVSSDLNCNNYLNHLEECEECRMYILNKYSKSNKLSDILSMNPQLKETLLVFLIGLLILMILNLFIK
jgi:formylmethanofuran dehydrogenase subunit E